MNPGLVVKLRPSGPWRIGPDSGARNRVDFIYHSDTLYSAVTSAMAKLGSLDEWLSATARAASPEVCFSSCFPFIDDVGYVIPPRTIWPPVGQATTSARTRWKSARFVPLGIVQSILAGRKLKEQQWAVDGASQCLVPVGKLGPFRTDTRWSAAVDRLSGSSERHSTTCIEFRPGAGLWTIVSFRDEASHEKWLGPVKAAFRLLADTGFGGERSRGWGRAETPEFVEGQLPDMILPPAPEKAAEAAAAPVETAPVVVEPAPVPEAEPEAAPESDPVPAAEPEPEPETAEASVEAPPDIEALVVTPDPEPEPPQLEDSMGPPVENEPEPQTVQTPVDEAPLVEAPVEAPPEELPDIAPLVLEKAPVPEPPQKEEPEPAPQVPSGAPNHHWLLSLFSPAAADTVDWSRGSYAMVTRAGRIESPAGSGELKKLVQMVAEGSVLYSDTAPTGTAPDVAPDGFAHPVFRAGFALSIPLRGGRS